MWMTLSKPPLFRKTRAKLWHYKYPSSTHPLPFTFTSTWYVPVKAYIHCSNLGVCEDEFQKASTLLIIFFISVAILSHVGIEATRVLSQDFAGSNHVEKYSSIYKEAKHTIAYWLERLPSGPSPRGAGH
ncbi:hypothetical protein CJ030_MR3G001088 [Morella rubra]|uniref:Uncharacterized protein n=1 Tax=Morella rubra TaxID=262757 RepID=A0A6A1W2E9_9ROSI|nr:hypothetical protein CJ030_MR3G001088 [Morella rubra]